MIDCSPLRRLATLVNGGTPTSDDSYWGGDVPWATPVDLARVDGGTILTTDRTLTAAGVVAGSATVPARCVLLSTRAPIGYTAITESATAFNQGCKGLIPNEGVDPRILRYWLSASRQKLLAAGSGSTFMELSSDALMSFETPTLPAEHQRRVADFLDDQVGRIDKVIASRRRQLDLTQEALTSSLTAVFEREPLVPLRRFVREAVVGIVVRPAALYTDDEDGIPALRGTNVVEGGIQRDNLVRITPTGHAAHPRSQLCAGDVVVVRTGDAGMAAVVPPQAVGWNCIDLVIVRPASDVVPAYIEHALNAARRATAIGAVASGSIQQHFGVGALLGLPVTLRSVDHQRESVQVAEAARQRAETGSTWLHESISLLQELKRSLITAAVTGQFDVSSADASRVPV